MYIALAKANIGFCGGLCFCCWHGRWHQCHHSHLPCTPRRWVRVGLPGERRHSWRLGGKFGREVGPGCLELRCDPQRGCGLQCRSYWPRVSHGRDRSWSCLGRSFLCPQPAVIDHHQDSGREKSLAILSFAVSPEMVMYCTATSLSNGAETFLFRKCLRRSSFWFWNHHSLTHFEMSEHGKDQRARRSDCPRTSFAHWRGRSWQRRAMWCGCRYFCYEQTPIVVSAVWKLCIWIRNLMSGLLADFTCFCTGLESLKLIFGTMWCGLECAVITSKLRYGGSQHREHGACYQQSGECEPPIARELYFYSFFLELGQRTEGMRKMIDNALGVRSDHLSNRIFCRTRKMKILLTFDNWTKLQRPQRRILSNLRVATAIQENQRSIVQTFKLYHDGLLCIHIPIV